MRHMRVVKTKNLVPRPYVQAITGYVKPAPTHVAHLECGPFLYSGDGMRVCSGYMVLLDSLAADARIADMLYSFVCQSSPRILMMSSLHMIRVKIIL